MKIPVGVSRRHAHLTKEVYEKLFGHSNIEIRNKLNQPGEFASTDTIDLVWEDKTIERVRIVGPFRDYNQVELSLSDSKILGVNLDRRKSGNVKESHPVILKGPKGEVKIEEGLVMAERHIHMGEKDAKTLNLVDDELLEVYRDDEKLFEATVKLIEPSYLELHIDEDEANEYNLKQNDEVIIKKI